ncbi:MAG: molybdenum cofactor biosynthesis protein MoaE [Candidatus Dadabacteria bacterium]|nr:molybdenum cofactor biosynthesis protein MoaE [Candidatus Dadabacteria bacterium]MCZ6639053.1 molybdenum cofactor biosynthesis protein MoaE [Candidatus Dadabacteria bacterium]
MKIKILLFGQLRSTIGRNSIVLGLTGSEYNVQEIKELVYRDFPDIKKEIFRVVVNQEICDDNHMIKEGDEIAFLPPISGGADSYITRKKISPEYITRVSNSNDSDCGSVLTFIGRIRKDVSPKDGETHIEKIEYSVYEEMAEKEIHRIVESAKNKFKVADIIVKHRIGIVKVGEVAFFVAVFSSHRKEGIHAIDFIIDEVKTKVPIWKKEIYSDGKEYWRDGFIIK